MFRSAEMLAAISRTARSASARREISTFERPSSSMSRAFWIATTTWSRERRHQRRVLVVVGVRPGRRDLQHAEQRRFRHQRRGQDGLEARPADEAVGLLEVVDPGIGEVVAGDHGRARLDGRRVDPDLGGGALRRPGQVATELALARRRRPADPAGRRIDDVELGALAGQQPAGGVGDLLEELGRVADRGDPGRDLAQLLLRAGPPVDLLRRTAPARRSGASCGSRSPPGGRGPRRARPARARTLPTSALPTWRTPRSVSSTMSGVITSERTPSSATARSRPGSWLNDVVVRVVVDDDRSPLGDRLAGGAVAVRLAVLVDGRAADVRPGPEERVADAPGPAPDQVDPHPVRVEQAGGLVDDVLEEVGRVPDRGDPGRDLAERPLLVRPLPLDRLRRRERLDQPGVRHRDRGLARERLEQPRVGLGERVDVAGVDRQGPHRAAVADERAPRPRTGSRGA